MQTDRAKLLGLIAVVSGSADHAAERKTVKKELLLLGSLLTRLGFRRLLGSFFGRHFQRLLSPWIRMPFPNSWEKKIGFSPLRHPTRETTAKSIHRLSTTHSHKKLMSCAICVTVLILRFVQ